MSRFYILCVIHEFRVSVILQVMLSVGILFKKADMTAKKFCMETAPGIVVTTNIVRETN